MSRNDSIIDSELFALRETIRSLKKELDAQEASTQQKINLLLAEQAAMALKFEQQAQLLTDIFIYSYNSLPETPNVSDEYQLKRALAKAVEAISNWTGDDNVA